MCLSFLVHSRLRSLTSGLSHAHSIPNYRERLCSSGRRCAVNASHAYALSRVFTIPYLSDLGDFSISVSATFLPRVEIDIGITSQSVMQSTS